MAYDSSAFDGLVDILAEQQSAYRDSLDEIETLNSALEAATAENMRLTDALAASKAENTQLKADLAASNAKVAQLTKDLADCQGGTTPPTPTPTGRSCFGFYRGGMTPNATYHGAESELKRTIGHILTFAPWDTWATIALDSWWTKAFGAAQNDWASDYGLIVSIPLVPKGFTVATADPAALKQAFTTAGQRLVAAGLQKCYIRIGWESQGDWYPWSSITNPGYYAARFRDAVMSLRQASGQQFKIDWNIAGGKKINMTAYPGDAYVDVISVDQYSNLAWDDTKAVLDETFKLATDHAKKWALTEWGVWGKDDSEWVRSVAGYLDTHPHAYQQYFDVNSSADHRLSTWPKTKAVYTAWAPKAICKA